MMLYSMMNLLLLCLIAVCFVAISARSHGNSAVRRDRAWKAKKAECEDKQCGHLIIEESYNCVNQCTSSFCYDEIYANDPLEDGELDYDREREFITCLRKEQMNARSRRSEQ